MMKILFIFFTILFISCCSYTKYDTCGINGSENYLKVDPLRTLQVPEGLTLPLFEQEYIIPSITITDYFNLNVGKRLNIYPPVVVY